MKIAFPDEALDDLRARLAKTRWPDPIDDRGGIPSARVREAVERWRDFDWRARERELNRLPHAVIDIDGQRIHFVHVRSKLPNATPLLLLHGWPGSFLEFLGVVDRLGDFDLVIPSLPGYGFSTPVLPGTSNRRIAELFAQLMTQLGYEQFAAQGGDWGAGVATWLALRHRERLTKLHLNYIPGSYRPHVDGELSDEEQRFVRDADEWSIRDGAYGAVQRTRPLTLAYGLNDSPAGLAAWIIEKFDEWADPASEIPLDELLTNVTLYWLTGTIHSSTRLYLEASKTPLRFAASERVTTPTAIAHFPLEAPFPPRAWIERGYDVVRWTDMPRGGHFAALEQPEAFAGDVRAFAGA